MRVCLLNATPCSILASSLRMSDAGVVRLLLFRVGRLVCAAEAERVREILPRLDPTRIPGAPPVVAGVVNVRGTLVTVVEGWRALRQPEPSADGEGGGTTVLLEVGGGKKVLGFTVDEVVDLVSVGGETLERRQALPGIDRTLVRAVGRREDPHVQRDGPAGPRGRGDPGRREGFRREAVPAVARPRGRPARPRLIPWTSRSTPSCSWPRAGST